MPSRRAPLPLTVVIPLLGGLIAVIPAVGHDNTDVRRVAIRVSLVLLGVGVFGVLVCVRHWVGRAAQDQEQLAARVDSWGALVGFLDGNTEPVPIEQGRRRHERRCRLVRGAVAAREHAGTVSAASVGVVVVVAVIASGGGHPQPHADAPEVRPGTPVTQPPPTPPATTTTSETPTSTAATRPPNRPAHRPPTRPLSTVTQTVTATVTAPPSATARALPLLELLAPAPDPPAAAQQDPATVAAAGPPSTSSAPPPMVLLEVGDG